MEAKVGSWTAVFLFVLQLTSILAKDIPTYFAPDGTLSLSPNFTGHITSILWRFNENMVAEWIKDQLDRQYYGKFNNRAVLDTKNGRLNLTQTTEADNGLFSVEINSEVQADRYEARMIQKVPDINAWVKPGLTDDQFVLYCDPVQGPAGALEAAEPVSYQWQIGTEEWVSLGRKVEINVNETILQVETFTCRMKNPVSEKTSAPKKNPLYGRTLQTDQGANVGLGVGLGLGLPLVAGVVAWLVYAFKKKKCPFSNTGNAPVEKNGNEEELRKMNNQPEPESA